LGEYHEVSINALFFRTFKDGDREYLTRAWLTEPITPTDGVSDVDKRGEWNGEYYVSFGVGKEPRKKTITSSRKSEKSRAKDRRRKTKILSGKTVAT
jgi:hypothetical protein